MFSTRKGATRPGFPEQTKRLIGGAKVRPMRPLSIFRCCFGRSQRAKQYLREGSYDFAQMDGLPEVQHQQSARGLLDVKDNIAMKDCHTQLLVLDSGLGKQLTNGTIGKSGEVVQLKIRGEKHQVTIEGNSIVGGLAVPDGIDVGACHIQQGDLRMYWTNMGTLNKNDGSVQCAKLDGSDVRYILKPGEGVHTPKQLVLDHENKKIYCCDREGLQVIRCNMDGSDMEVLYLAGDWHCQPELRTDAKLWPVGIAISPRLDKMFWSQKGGSKTCEGRIFVSNLKETPVDPMKRSDVALILSDLPEGVDLAFDEEEQFLYWTSRGELPFGNTLNRLHLPELVQPSLLHQGRQKPEIIAQGLCEGIGLSLDKRNDCVYIADLGGHVWKCGIAKDSGFSESQRKVKIYEGRTSAYTGVAVVKFGSQRSAPRMKKFR